MYKGLPRKAAGSSTWTKSATLTPLTSKQIHCTHLSTNCKLVSRKHDLTYNLYSFMCTNKYAKTTTWFIQNSSKLHMAAYELSRLPSGKVLSLSSRDAFGFWSTLSCQHKEFQQSRSSHPSTCENKRTTSWNWSYWNPQPSTQQDLYSSWLGIRTG